MNSLRVGMMPVKALDQRLQVRFAADAPTNPPEQQPSVEPDSGKRVGKKLGLIAATLITLGLTNYGSLYLGSQLNRERVLEDAALKNVNHHSHWCSGTSHVPKGIHHVETTIPIPGYFEKAVVGDLKWKLVDETRLPKGLFEELKDPPFVSTPSDAAEELVNKVFFQHLAGLVRAEWFRFDEENPQAFADRIQRLLTTGYDAKNKKDTPGDIGSPVYKNTDLYNLNVRLEQYGVKVLDVTVGVKKQDPAIQRPSFLDMLKRKVGL